MTHAQRLRQQLQSFEVDAQYTEAVLHFHDRSRLCFRHRVGERWARAIGPQQRDDETGLAGELLAAMKMFRLNAKHLDIHFDDDSRWDEPLIA
jgi:hypothetical protein